MEESTRQTIQSTLEGNDVVLFMKGTPAAPRCGFSAQVVQILGSLGVPYSTVDVLSNPEIREGIKEFSNWPTIPQLYVRREFVGGCDIVKEMYGSGELEEKLGVEVAEVTPPKITVTPRAAQALQSALESPEEGVRFEVDAKFNHGLSIGPQQPKDIVVEAGVKLLLDRASAKRANGTVIDYVETPEGSAFKIDNPNEPPKVRQIAPRDLQQRFDAGEKVELFDVRSPAEREIAAIQGSRLLDRDVQQYILGLSKETPIVFHCHHGSRSQQAAEYFLQQGFKNVQNLAGGIDAWSVEIDPTVPRY